MFPDKDHRSGGYVRANCNSDLHRSSDTHNCTLKFRRMWYIPNLSRRVHPSCGRKTPIEHRFCHCRNNECHPSCVRKFSSVFVVLPFYIYTRPVDQEYYKTYLNCFFKGGQEVTGSGVRVFLSLPFSIRQPTTDETSNC